MLLGRPEEGEIALDRKAGARGSVRWPLEGTQLILPAAQPARRRPAQPRYPSWRRLCGSSRARDGDGRGRAHALSAARPRPRQSARRSEASGEPCSLSGAEAGRLPAEGRLGLGEGKKAEATLAAGAAAGLLGAPGRRGGPTESDSATPAPFPCLNYSHHHNCVITVTGLNY